MEGEIPSCAQMHKHVDQGFAAFDSWTNSWLNDNNYTNSSNSIEHKVVFEGKSLIGKA